ncbi:hypothetical protein ACFYST_30760 [Kitasatospora sp. NPDC004614]|uniref:hypothetical protein n=1 Tax=unclassified Kitasatospora TaxID=2633591 RepID=UPI0036C0A0BC
MTGDGEELSVRMARFVAAEEVSAPPSRVDPALAVRRGRAVLRRRSWSVVAAAAAAAVLAAGSFTLLGGNGDGWDPSARPTDRGAGWPAPVPGHTVLTVPARFGWLPAEVTEVEFRSSSAGVEVVATGAGPHFTLTAFPVGVTPLVDPLLGPGDGVRVDAPPVNGQEAYWMTSSDPGFARTLNLLRFRGPDGRWFQLDSTGLAEADRQQLPLRVATGVVMGKYTPPMPVAFSSLPAEAVVTQASLRHTVGGSDLWTARVGLQERGGHAVTVSAVPEGPGEATLPLRDTGLCTSGKGMRWCVDELHPASDEQSKLQVWLTRVVPRGADDREWSVDVLP